MVAYQWSNPTKHCEFNNYFTTSATVSSSPKKENKVLNLKYQKGGSE